MVILRIGSKGELFLPKKLREELELSPGSKVEVRVEGDSLVIKPIPSLKEVLSQPSLVEVSLEEFHEFRKELSRRAES